jgi:hypothetical protein
VSGQHEAGAALDRLIATQVMGWTWDADTNWPDGRDWATQMSDDAQHWSPSTDIAHAWEVVERMRKSRHLGLELMPKTTPIGSWSVSWADLGGVSEDDYEMFCVDHRQVYRTAPTAMLAICLAALAAVGADSPLAPPASRPVAGNDA